MSLCCPYINMSFATAWQLETKEEAKGRKWIQNRPRDQVLAFVQYEGWPLTVDLTRNDGRKPIVFLKQVNLPVANAVVELTDSATGDLARINHKPSTATSARHLSTA